MDREENSFLAGVEAAIRRYGMLDPGDTVLVGLSGGPDSVALLHSLVAMRSIWSLRLVAVHLNHQLRGLAAEKESDFVEELASHLNIPCVIGSRDVRSYRVKHRLSIQEAAREVRYTFYDETAEKYGAQKIALGHQKNDNAESILMHLLRGTGPRGLSGITPVRQGRIIRPLLDVTRNQVLGFLQRHGLEYLEDPSNADRKYLRNKIRHELLPILERDFNVKVTCTLTRLASIARDEEHFWNGMVKATFKDLVTEHKTDSVVFPASHLARLHRALLRRLIRHAVLVLKGDLKRLSHNHVEAVCRFINRGAPSGWLDLPRGIGVARDGDEIRFTMEPQTEKPQFQYPIAGTGRTLIPEIGEMLRLCECEIHDRSVKLPDQPEGEPTGSALQAKSRSVEPKGLPREKAFFDLQALSFPLVVRNVRQGDRFTPLGMSGSQKVKDFFINQKVPRSQRHQCPLLLSKGKIIWVGKLRIDDSVKVTEATDRVLMAELVPA
jgi:tRNA(Ile)-lysidine synthase